MHRSQLAGFIIDCKTEDLRAAATFWGAALGMKLKGLDGEEGEHYVRLEDPAHGLTIEVQKVRHESRVHLDIETDDVEAEVERMRRGVEIRLFLVHPRQLPATPRGEGDDRAKRQHPTDQQVAADRGHAGAPRRCDNAVTMPPSAATRPS